MNELDMLLEVWERLATRERKVALAYLWRLYAGQKKFGPLTIGKKDWSYEAIEEALDSSVYLTAMLVDRADLALMNAVKDAEDSVAVREEEGACPVVGGEDSSSAGV